MKDILVHDLRVQGQTVPGHYAKFDVDATTPLSYFVTRTLQEAAAYNDDARLIIFAHGMEHPTLGGGFGIAFCREDLTLNTIGRLAPLHGHIHGGIVLRSCAIAHMAPGRDNLIGDSNVFCSRLAQIVGTRVTAPTSSQRAAWARGPGQTSQGRCGSRSVDRHGVDVRRQRKGGGQPRLSATTPQLSKCGPTCPTCLRPQGVDQIA